MKDKAKFDRTVGILVQAYLNDTLERGDCMACAVGNLVAANMGYRIVRDNRGRMEWPGVPNGNNRSFSWYHVVVLRHEPGDLVAQQIKATGYTAEELRKIEGAFEDSAGGDSREGRMYSGLMAVVDVLCEIHEAGEPERVAAREMFVKP